MKLGFLRKKALIIWSRGEIVVSLSVMRKAMMLVCLTAVLRVSVSAQVRKPNAPAPNAGTRATVSLPVNKLFEQMLPATAKVMFIDSVVAGKEQFAGLIPLSPEAGVVAGSTDATASFGEQLFSYTNGFGNRRIFATAPTDSTSLLCKAYLLGETWSEAQEIGDLNSEVENPNFPFLLADGTTLYFAAKGEKSMGGYDIFMTIFDTEAGRYYSPQNVGLPFNSEANDYLLVIDETTGLGWLVTDRNQPGDSVCIYTFVPTETRESFEGDHLDRGRLSSLARIDRIADTWAFGNREEALRRLADAVAQQEKKTGAPAGSFVIGDHLTYHHADDFESAEARKTYQQLGELLAMQTLEERKLSQLRTQYCEAKQAGREKLAAQILEGEQQLRQIYRDVEQLSKDARNKEIEFINKSSK